MLSVRCRSWVGEEQAVKKRKTNKASHTTISSLPDDLVLSCLARVSRLYYPSLSLVSKKFRSLIASPEIFKVRSLLGMTESCLYVCLDFRHCSSNFRWFTLCRESSEYLLVPIPSSVQFPSPQSDLAGLVAVGSNIYWIGGYICQYMGGSIDKTRSSRVSILDCHSHTWQEAPNMYVRRRGVAANVIDGKIYVIGGRFWRDYNSSNLIEFLDPETQIWNSMSSPDGVVCETWNIHSIVIDGKIFMHNNGKNVAYNPKDSTFEPIEWDMCKVWIMYPHCVVDNVVFYHDKKDFKWFDFKARLWRDLKGLQGMPKIDTDITRVNLEDYGGKIAVFWDKDVSCSGPDKEIWCAVIVIERRNSEEIWGTVEWVGAVLTVPKACWFVRALATTL